jgi:DNA-binding transcriptional MerR regulator
LVVITSPDMLLTRAQAAEVAGVSVERIRTWERRKHLERAGVDENGWPLYRAVDVAKCKHRFQGLGRGEEAA